MPQTLSNVLLHIVFSTKNREPMIRAERKDELHRYLATTCASHGCPAIQVGGTNDHVHICCRLATTIAISDLVRKVKAGSSKWMKTHGPTFQHFAWQRGYGAFASLPPAGATFSPRHWRMRLATQAASAVMPLAL